MPRRYLKRPAAWMLLLIVFLLLSFSMSGNSSETMTKRVIQIHLELYADQARVNKACDAKPGKGVNGCTWNLGTGRWKIVALKPRDFCDWNRMRTLGHEMLHAAGFQHSDDYLFDEGGDIVSWSASSCEMTR